MALWLVFSSDIRFINESLNCISCLFRKVMRALKRIMSILLLFYRADTASTLPSMTSPSTILLGLIKNHSLTATTQMIMIRGLLLLTTVG